MRPILCNYYITYRCNARCTFCDIWKAKKYHSVPDAKLANVASNMPQLKKAGVRFIDFTGGEPLLHRQLPEMLKLAKAHGLRTSVTTNCLEYPRTAESLRGLVDLLHFSLDGTSAAEHDELRGRTVFNQVMNSIRIAHDLNEIPDLLFTATPQNFRVVAALSELAARERLMLIVNPVFQYSDQEILTHKMLDTLDHYGRKPYVYINMALHRLIRAGGNSRRRPRCQAVTSSVVISPDNHLLTPCFHFANTQIPINGNLFDLMNSVARNEQKALQGRHSFCQNCTINCYFDPSFLYRADVYWGLSLISKAKYGFDKYIRRPVACAVEHARADHPLC